MLNQAKFAAQCVGLFVVASLLWGCGTTRNGQLQGDACCTHYIVAADHQLASQAGQSILAAGGNVVDAAVATALALDVVRPYSTGISGGGFMVISMVGKPPMALDYRETAPRAAIASAYVDDQGKVIPDKTVLGHWAVGVPGQIRGLALALRDYGTMSFAQVLEPAIRLAEGGFAVDGHTHKAMVVLGEQVRRDPEQRFGEIAKIFLRDAQALNVGEKLVQPDLAATLRRLAERGAEEFYSGEIGEKIVAEMAQNSGPLQRDDLVNYRVKKRAPLKTHFRGLEVWGMPPPSSGGACLQEILNVMDGYGPRQLPAGDYFHLLTEAMKHAFADRASSLGDADFHPEVAADVAKMLSPAYAERIRALIAKDKTSLPAHYGQAWIGRDSGTSHYSIIDSQGNAVAGTDTINLPFGSLVVPRGTGVVLNNELDDFAVKTDVPNAFGLMMSSRNVVQPGQRPLSSMSPTIIRQDGRAILAAGASGGPLIITATLQGIVQVIDFGQTPQAAVSLPRLHHQWSPDELRIEKDMAPAVVNALKQKGHRITVVEPSLGATQIVYRTTQNLQGGSDPRKGGKPAGQ